MTIEEYFKQNNLNINTFNIEQISEIEKGLKIGLDVSKYAKPKFNKAQMKQIRLGLKEGLYISCYAIPEFSWEQMEQIRKGLEMGLDVSKYAKPNITLNEMKKIYSELLSKKNIFSKKPKDESLFFDWSNSKKLKM